MQAKSLSNMLGIISCFLSTCVKKFQLFLFQKKLKRHIIIKIKIDKKNFDQFNITIISFYILKCIYKK